MPAVTKLFVQIMGSFLRKGELAFQVTLYMFTTGFRLVCDRLRPAHASLRSDFQIDRLLESGLYSQSAILRYRFNRCYTNKLCGRPPQYVPAPRCPTDSTDWWRRTGARSGTPRRFCAKQGVLKAATICPRPLQVDL